MSKISIEPMMLTPELLEILCKFDEDSQQINFPNDKPNRSITIPRIRKEFADEPEGMSVVKSGEDVAGCLFLKTDWNPYRECAYGDVRNIYLTEKFRGRGNGTLLMRYADKYFREKKCKYVSLGTSAHNQAAIGLYEKSGFDVERVVMMKELI